MRDQGRGEIVLLHGLGANSLVMGPLAWRLRQRGFTTHNWGYGSVGTSLRTLVPMFRERLLRLADALPEGRPLHVVGHSLGSIIGRAVLSETDLPTSGRIVMICPPNRGSHVGTLLGPYLRWLTPLVEELADRHDSFVNRLPDLPTWEVGVIAADRDRVVAESSTHLESEADHIVLTGMHGDLVFRSTVAEQVESFLAKGRFKR